MPAAKSRTRPPTGRIERNKRSGKTQSKSCALRRSQNAFDLAEDDNEDQAVPVNHAFEYKSENDEEIDSEDAFESGDEERFDSFRFSGSRARSDQVADKQMSRIRLSQTRASIDLDEADDSSQKESSVQRERSRTKAPDSEPDDNSSASDFEDDTGNDLIDLSEMLNAKPAPLSSVPIEDALSLASAKILRDAGRPDQVFSDSAGESDYESDSVDDLSSPGESALSDSISIESDGNEDALEKFVAGLEQKRKQPDDGDLQIPKDKKQRISVPDFSETVKESEYNLATSGKKLQLEDMLSSLGKTTLKGLKKVQTLQAPLAKPIQDRIDRAAAFETVKEQVSRWQPAVKELREASVLKFPLKESAKIQSNNNSLASTFKASNGMEQEISTILRESGLQSEKAISAFEDLEMAKLSVEDVKKRRAELAIMRDLMFRQERKAKRQNKIKSKAYRKVHRKEKDKMRAELEETEGNPVEIFRKREEQRARERMELRHKNTGKWAQKMISRADHSEGSRAAITEQLQRSEDLERKIRGVENRGDDDDDDSEDDDDDDGGGNASLSGNLLVDDVSQPLPNKGVFAMKFMRDADEEESRLANEQDEYDEEQSEKIQGQNQGRLSFHPAALRDAKDGISEHPVSHSEAGASRSEAELDRAKIMPEPRTRSSISTIIHVLGASSTDTKKQKRPQLHQGRIKATSSEDLSRSRASGTGDDVDEIPALLLNKGQVGQKQADLVARAFASEDVVAQFEASKEVTRQEDAPQEIDETLPGWGSWIGNGIQKRPHSKRFVRHVDGIDVDKRKDAKLKHVVINEKRMKQAKTLLSQSVPFPFETKTQYERSLGLPIGPEWTTRTNFQQQITPHVIKRQGAVIAPMEKPFRD